jgi:hypothetical protein
VDKNTATITPVETMLKSVATIAQANTNLDHDFLSDRSGGVDMTRQRVEASALITSSTR